ncbi:MAG: hypothetical protein M1819_005353 [Sarea resinae]|nr:MAG: hypothetical protein M1819_005353 [Sarea resinae]
MSNSSFSNANTGDKPADPYKAKNVESQTPLKEKVEDLVSFIEAQKFGMMTTRVASSGLLEEGGVDLLFHTNTESGKTDDLQTDKHINISFLDSTGAWASVSGTAEIDTDRATVKKYYSPALKAWLGDLGDGVHDGGPDDPRIGVIKVKAITATYAVTTRGVLGRNTEFIKGVVTGQAPEVNKLRELSSEELDQWRATH